MAASRDENCKENFSACENTQAHKRMSVSTSIKKYCASAESASEGIPFSCKQNENCPKTLLSRRKNAAITRCPKMLLAGMIGLECMHSRNNVTRCRVTSGTIEENVNVWGPSETITPRKTFSRRKPCQTHMNECVRACIPPKRILR